MAEHVAQDFNSFRAVSHVPKFDGTNHREWNYEIHLCFQAMEVDSVVLGTELCPAEVTNFNLHSTIRTERVEKSALWYMLSVNCLMVTIVLIMLALWHIAHASVKCHILFPTTSVKSST